MNGSMMTTGRYVIPLPEIGQISIDCEMIPVIEFDDGSVVLMDFKGQMPEKRQKNDSSKLAELHRGES